MSLNDINQFDSDSDDTEEVEEVQEVQEEVQPLVEPEQEVEVEEVQPEVRVKRKYTKKDKNEPKTLSKKEVKAQKLHDQELEILKHQTILASTKSLYSSPVNQAEQELKVLLREYTKYISKIVNSFRKNEDKEALISNYNTLRKEFDIDFDNIIFSIPEKYTIPSRIYDKVDFCLDKNEMKVKNKL